MFGPTGQKKRSRSVVERTGDALPRTFSSALHDKVMRSGFSIAHLLLALNQKSDRLSLRLDA
jgi:hypothetical protein